MRNLPTRRDFLGVAVALTLNATPAFAQPPSQKRKAMVRELADVVRKHYQDEATAMRLADALLRNLDAGAYDNASITDAAFAARLTSDLRAIIDDKHMAVMSGMTGKEADITVDPAFAVKLNYGVQAARRLPGNIGLIEVNFFPALKFGDALLDRYAAAMVLVRDTRALIVDLREHMGGDPGTVAYFVSYFFERPSFVVNRIRYRPDRIDEFATTTAPRGGRYGERRPMFVLTSANTFSGGEELAYDLQATRRARVVGEVTGGGANPNEAFDLGEGFIAYVPNGAAINPITRTNWEGVGVAPDVKLEPARAQAAAQRMALETALAQAADEAERASIREALNAMKT